MASVKIVGLGHVDDVCALTGTTATGYIECPVSKKDMIPCNLDILGPGKIGQYVWCPKKLYNQYIAKLQLQKAD